MPRGLARRPGSATGTWARWARWQCILLTINLSGCTSTKLAIGDDVRSPVVIGSRLQIGEQGFQTPPITTSFNSQASEEIVAVGGGAGGSHTRQTWRNDLVQKANWAVQGSARRAIRNCEVSAEGTMQNLLFLIDYTQTTHLRGDVVEVERPDDAFEDEDSGDSIPAANGLKEGTDATDIP